MRKLTEKDVTFTLSVEYDDTPVRGNALACGDDAADKECEDEIIRRLDNGDVWAWCVVRVTATYELPDGSTLEGWDTLGACCYKNERDFKLDGYYVDMKAEAVEDLNRRIQDEINRGRALAELFDA